MSEAGDRDAGVTLLEALVVLSIFALISALCFPAVEHVIAQAAFRESAAVIVADLRVAHAAALHRSSPVTFDVAPDGTRFGLNGDLRHILPDDITVHMASGTSVVFFGDGSASGGQVTLSGRRRELRVQIDPATGAVSGGAL